jgi:phosphomannomutase
MVEEQASRAESVKFGTSGLRGLALELQGDTARRYTEGFLDYLIRLGVPDSGSVYLARDLRPSSPAILQDCAAAVVAAGLVPIDSGPIPTPALALYAMGKKSPAIMITGSHIPADRNGLKFYSPAGEISKADEAGILACTSRVTEVVGSTTCPKLEGAAADLYLARYTLPAPLVALAGLRVGVFEHSASLETFSFLFWSAAAPT